MTSISSQAFGLDRKNRCLKKNLNENYDLRIGEPKNSPFPYDVFEELKTRKNINIYYPSHGDLALREMILEKYYEKHLVDNIAITHGAMGALDFIFRSYLNSDSEVLLPDPGFPPYNELAQFTNAKIKKYSLNFTNNAETFIHWEHLDNLITEKKTLILFNSPHNPTGKVFTEMDFFYFEEMLVKYPQLTFIMDEVYRGLIYGSRPHFNYSAFIDRGYIVGSFSKILPLQGARIGWVLSSVDKIKQLSPYFNNAAGAMSSFGQEIVKTILKRRLSFKNIYFQALSQVVEILDSYNVEYIYPEGTFFVFIKYEISDWAVVDELAELGVEVVPGSVFGAHGANYIRASFAQPSEILDDAFEIIGHHWSLTHPRKLS